MLFTMNWLKEIFPNVEGKVAGDKKILQYTTDSRLETEDSLFIPLIGESFDGHKFILQAIENGAIAALWDEKKPIPRDVHEDFVFFYVDDTTKGLQALAAKYRDEINPIVIGITGSNGKTTTKDIVASISKEKYITHYTQGNLNNEFGLPFTILSMKRDTEVLVLEMGMSSFGEIELLSNIARPDYAIITNIGESHIEYLGSRDGIAKAKLEITSGLKEDGKLIIDGDEALLLPVHQQDRVIKVGFGAENDLALTNIKIERNETTFTGSNNITYTVPLLGTHHAKNAGFGIMIGKQLGLSNEQIQHALENLTLTGMRFEILQGKNNVSVINDAYNASPTSMKAAIEVAKQMEGFHKKILVLGDIFELGNQSVDLHKSVADVIDDSFTALYTVGKDSKIISDTVSEDNPEIITKHFETKNDLIVELEPYLNEQTLILFKASRGMELETVIRDIN